MKETQKLEKMSAALFLALYPKDEVMRTLDEIISILDAGGYWDNRRDYTLKQKQNHGKRRLKSIKTHDGTGYSLFIPWPVPFEQTRYMFALDAYKRHVLGKHDEDGDTAADEEWPDIIGGE
jgi:hypothetical protein